MRSWSVIWVAFLLGGFIRIGLQIGKFVDGIAKCLQFDRGVALIDRLRGVTDEFLA